MLKIYTIYVTASLLFLTACVGNISSVEKQGVSKNVTSSAYNNNTFDVLNLVSKLKFKVTADDEDCKFTIVEPAYQASNEHLLRNNSIYGNIVCTSGVDYFAALNVHMDNLAEFSIEVMDDKYDANKFELVGLNDTNDTIIVNNDVNDDNIFGILSMNVMHYFPYGEYNSCHFETKSYDEATFTITGSLICDELTSVQDETQAIVQFVQDETSLANETFLAYMQVYPKQPYRYTIHTMDDTVLYNSEKVIQQLDSCGVEIKSS